MRKLFDTLFKSQSLIYKYLLYIATVCCIVFFFPKGGQFKYEFQKGKPWQHDNLYAPFDFSIKKTNEEIEREKRELRSRQSDYYRYDEGIVRQVYQDYESQFPTVFGKDQFNTTQIKTLYAAGKELLDRFYEFGVLQETVRKSGAETLYLVKKNEADRIDVEQLYEINGIGDEIDSFLREKGLRSFSTAFRRLFRDLIKANVGLDKGLTDRAMTEALSKISSTRGTVDEGKLIIAKGEVVVQNEKYGIRITEITSRMDRIRSFSI